VIVVVVAIGGGIWYVHSSDAPSFDQTTVQKGNIVESVDQTANVLAENSAAVSFQEGGQIAHVYVQEGSTVAAGTILADLDASQLNAGLQQANAALAAAQAQLAQLQSGTRPEQLQIDQTAVANAKQTLAIAVENAYSASDDAVQNQLDNLFSTPNGNSPTFLVPSSNSASVNALNSQRLTIGVALAQWYATLNATSTVVDPSTLAPLTITNLQQIKTYIDSISLIVNGATSGSSLPAATLAQYKADVSTARNEVEASISAVSGDQSALASAQAQLTLAQAGATSESIQAQQAVVAQAQAAASSAQVALAHASLVAPFSGTVQGLTAQAGQVVSPGMPMLSLINNGGLKIQAYVSQTDVAKIKTGDTANVTIDAFGTGTIFPATVTTIDAAQTQVNGSAAYLVTLHFVNPDGRLKDGMTGNVDIIAAEHDNVLEVPSNLVINDDNSYFVLVQNGSTIQKQPVQIGLVGDNGMTEIMSGLNVGDHINNF
jgi:RND family efflux transporter MFP subunit